MTTYMNVEADVPRVEIGSTWTAASAQGTAVNPESKLLLLGHAFDAIGCLAVEFRAGLPVVPVRAELHGQAADGVEGVAQQQQLALRVHRGALGRRRRPGGADLHPGTSASTFRYVVSRRPHHPRAGP